MSSSSHDQSLEGIRTETKPKPTLYGMVSLKRIPCFRRALIDGMGVGILIGLGNLFRYRNGMAVVKGYVMGFVSGGLVSYLYCRETLVAQKKYIAKTMQPVSRNPTLEEMEKARPGLQKISQFEEEQRFVKRSKTL